MQSNVTELGNEKIFTAKLEAYRMTYSGDGANQSYKKK